MKMQDVYKVFGKSACLAICYLYINYYEQATEAERNLPGFLETVVNSVLFQAFINKVGLDEECFVTNAAKLIPTWKVEKRKVDAIPKDEWSVVKFEYNGNGHWVAFHKGILLYNSLQNSVCYKYGKPVDARILTKVI